MKSFSSHVLCFDCSTLQQLKIATEGHQLQEKEKRKKKNGVEKTAGKIHNTNTAENRLLQMYPYLRLT